MEDQLLELKRKFEITLQEKTSWGRNELKTAFNALLLEVSQGARTFEPPSTENDSFENLIKTGELKCQFDDEEPIRLYQIHDYKPFTITLQQPTIKDCESIKSSMPSIAFYSASKKTFKLFIE